MFFKKMIRRLIGEHMREINLRKSQNEAYEDVFKLMIGKKFNKVESHATCDRSKRKRLKQMIREKISDAKVEQNQKPRIFSDLANSPAEQRTTCIHHRGKQQRDAADARNAKKSRGRSAGAHGFTNPEEYRPWATTNERERDKTPREMEAVH